jgi:hypothetical protein
MYTLYILYDPAVKCRPLGKTWALSCVRRARVCQDSGIVPTAQAHRNSSRPAERPALHPTIPGLRDRYVHLGVSL